jgi:hypothetical protein
MIPALLHLFKVHDIHSHNDAIRLFSLLDSSCNTVPLLSIDVRIASAVIRLIAETAIHLNCFLDTVPATVRVAVDTLLDTPVADLLAADASLVDSTLQLLAVAASFDSLGELVPDSRHALAFAANCFQIDSLFVERAVCRLLAHLASFAHLAAHVRVLVLGDTHVALQVLLESLSLAPRLPEPRRSISLALIANDLLPNALVSLSHAERLVQVAALDCVTLATEHSPPIVDIGAVCAKVAAFVANGDARSSMLAFRLVAALHAPTGDAASVDRLLALFDDALERSSSGFDRFLNANADAVEWRVTLLAALRTAQQLVARYGRGDSARLWSLLPRCIALKNEIAGDASGGIALAALTLLTALGRCESSRWQLAPQAEASIVAALQLVTSSTDMRQASLMLLLQAAVDAMTMKPALAAVGNAVSMLFVAAVRSLCASDLWERRDSAVDAAVKLVQLNRAFAEQLSPLVVAALSDEQPYVRASALAGLAALYRHDAVPPSEALLRGIGALGDTEAVVRRAACVWLDVLLAHDDASVRDAAIARVRQTRAAFDRLVVDADWEVKRQLIVVLSSILRLHKNAIAREFGCIQQLLALVEDSARLVRLDAAIALASVQQQDGHQHLTSLDFAALVEINSKLEPWNTDFDGIEVTERSHNGNTHDRHHHGGDSDDDNDVQHDDDVPLDCE